MSDACKVAGEVVDTWQKDGGWTRSSEETSVMEAERRGPAV